MEAAKRKQVTLVFFSKKNQQMNDSAGVLTSFAPAVREAQVRSSLRTLGLPHVHRPPVDGRIILLIRVGAANPREMHAPYIFFVRDTAAGVLTSFAPH